jgi:hypothetical protein
MVSVPASFTVIKLLLPIHKPLLHALAAHETTHLIAISHRSMNVRAKLKVTLATLTLDGIGRVIRTIKSNDRVAAGLARTLD